jgi:hypothetical protein
MTRREAMLKAWYDWNVDEGESFVGQPNYYFEDGFNAAWDMLMAEIRPLVDSLDEIRSVTDHEATVERLRELIRETER